MKYTELNLLSLDIETLLENFLVKIHIYEIDEWVSFSVSKWKNELFAFVKFAEEYKNYYWIGFNNLNFDSQILEFIIRNHQKWVELDNLEITRIIWQKAQDVISDINNDLFPPYKEDDLSFRVIDIFKIHHWDNSAKRTSLKWLEFMMDMENIEDMPISHDRKGMTKEEVEDVYKYCINDVLSTDRGYEYTIGDVEGEEYKGKNKIQDRIDIMEEFGFSHKCLNWSDVKIGDELNKLGYCNLTGKTQKDIYELKKKRGNTKRFTFGDCIPSYVEFLTPEFKAFFDSVRNIKVNMIDDKQEFPFSYKGTNYVIARGGIHSTESNRIIIAGENEILEDSDIGSQYPRAIIKRELFPSHLGKEWLVNYQSTMQKRVEAKKKGKDNPKYKSVAEGLKLALNGGGFGMTNQNTNWQYDPRVTFFCTIGNEFEILMLIEQMEINGIRVVSANTDGILCLYNKELEEKHKEICEWWERKVGNFEEGKLEHTIYKKIVQESVNHYIAIKEDGERKIKGRFCTDVWLNKNNTDKIGRIERKAIVEYFCEQKPVEKTIRECKNIFDFCIGIKSSRDYHFITLDWKTGQQIEEFNRVSRYIITKEGKRLIKAKREHSEATGAEITRVVDGWKVEVVNHLPKEKHEYWLQQIEHQYYIENAQRVIDRIETNRKKQLVINPNQQSLF